MAARRSVKWVMSIRVHAVVSKRGIVADHRDPAMEKFKIDPFLENEIELSNSRIEGEQKHKLKQPHKRREQSSGHAKPERATSKSPKERTRRA